MFSLRRVLPVLVLVVVHTMVMVPTAFAGGTWMRTPDQQVESGEEVDLVGYVWAADRSSLEESQWLAHFNLAPMPEHGSVEPQLISLGPVTVEPSGLRGYLEYRVSLTFTIPENLEPGHYMITVANQQGDYLGDLIGASLAIGVEPWPPSYEWPVDEPLVAQLPDDAWLRGPNWEITAGQVKRKIYPSCQWSCFLDPSLLEDPRAIVVDATPTRAATPSISPTTSTVVSTVETTIESTGPPTASVLALDIPSENAEHLATAPAPVEGGWLDLWWVLLTIGGAAYLVMRRAELSAVADPLVVEDDVTEPIKV